MPGGVGSLLSVSRAVTLLRFVAGMGCLVRSTLRPYWLDRVRCWFDCGLRRRLLPGNPWLRLSSNPSYGFRVRQRPLRLYVAASAWDPGLELSVCTTRVDLVIAGMAPLLVVGRGRVLSCVQRQAEPSASREVPVPYSVLQPRCAVSGVAGIRTIPLRRWRRFRLDSTDVGSSDGTLALAVLRSALATRLTSGAR
jgi:hypothetical protein